jgi:hypothetical protein
MRKRAGGRRRDQQWGRGLGRHCRDRRWWDHRRPHRPHGWW